MGKTKISREVTLGDVHCLENLVVAYNTVLLMTSIFIVIISSTTLELFSDINKILSPSTVLLVVGCFIVILATLGYVGIAKKSSSLISLYTMLLVFVFVLEMSAGFCILSYRTEIKSMVYSKMKRAITAYPVEPMTANLVDYVQLELQCCGINSFRDWDNTFETAYQTACKIGDISLPTSCCTRTVNSTFPVVNKRGCLSAVSFLLHRSSLSLTTAIIAICTIQILGAYFSYSLATSLSKYKIQKASTIEISPPQYDETLPVGYKEKSGYF